MFDGRNCPEISSSNATIRYLEVLPGYGFDALTNLHMGQVFVHNYSICKVTMDGKFLIPDSVSVIPMKENHYQLHAELFEHWSSYTSLTSSKINIGSPIFGLFSDEKQAVKEKQETYNAGVTRTFFRNKAYEVTLDVISELHPDFKSKIYEIAAYAQNNDTKLAAYYSEMLVNEYGTHYVTAVNAGALVVKLDCLSESYTANTNRENIKSAAILSFPYYEQLSKALDLHLDIASGYSQGYSDEYRKNVLKLDIYTMGGAQFTPNLNFTTWLRDVPNNMVTIERYGKQLHYAISSSLFPELLPATMRKIAAYVRTAVEKYIDINEKQVHAQLGSEQQNFIFRIGGLDQESGRKSRPTKIFGGIYQSCTTTRYKYHRDTCTPIANQLIGTPGRCPFGYKAIPLFVDTIEPFEIFWCGTLDSLSIRDNGFVFGGFHSAIRENPLTEKKPVLNTLNHTLCCGWMH